MLYSERCPKEHAWVPVPPVWNWCFLHGSSYLQTIILWSVRKNKDSICIQIVENIVKSDIPALHLSSAAYIYFRIYCDILLVSLGEENNPELFLFVDILMFKSVVVLLLIYWHINADSHKRILCKNILLVSLSVMVSALFLCGYPRKRFGND